MILRRAWTPATTRLLQLGLAMLAVQYMLLIGGTFGATIQFKTQRLNLAAGAGIALAWLLIRVIQRRPLALTGLELPLILFVASQWLAVITSTQPRLGLDWAASVTTWSLAFLILMDWLSGGWPRSFWINALVVAAVIVTADGIWSAAQWFAGWAALGALPPVTFRYYGWLGHANLTAAVINLLWPVVIARLIHVGRMLSRLALGALTVGLALTSFFTSSRSGWLAGGVSAALLIATFAFARAGPDWLRAGRGLWQRLTTAARLAAIIAIVVAALAGAWLLLKQSQQITHASVFDARQQFWSVAWDLFRSKPLTGVGPDLYPWFYSRFESIPPDFFAPHAHSVVLQILSGSGLVGFAALLFLCGAIAVRLWKQWTSGGRPAETACLIVALVGFAVHGLFDFLVTPISLLLLVILLALAWSPTPGPKPPRSIHPVLAAPFLILPIGLFAFLLQGSGGNDAGLKLADANQWPAAAQVFERTAQADPQLTLYWEEAAYAYTLAGDVPKALPLWDRAAHDDPNWALLPATIGALKEDLAAAQAARVLAPRSYLFALNTGTIAEAQGSTAAAQEGYLAALQLKPTIATALFWQQSSLRRGVASNWQSGLPPDSSTLARGWAALAANAPEQAITLFKQAAVQAPDGLAPYLGLGKAYLQLHDPASAQRAAQSGLAIPIVYLEDSLPMHLLAGDVDDARGDRAGAIAEYSLVFSAIADYGIDGPGSYAYPQRSWYVFHREALPADLVPQLPRADINADMDQRFAQLAQWYRQDGQTSLACLILGRVRQEAPQSASGSLYLQLCLAISH